MYTPELNISTVYTFDSLNLPPCDRKATSIPPAACTTRQRLRPLRILSHTSKAAWLITSGPVCLVCLRAVAMWGRKGEHKTWDHLTTEHLNDQWGTFDIETWYALMVLLWFGPTWLADSHGDWHYPHSSINHRYGRPSVAFKVRTFSNFQKEGNKWKSKIYGKPIIELSWKYWSESFWDCFLCRYNGCDG